MPPATYMATAPPYSGRMDCADVLVYGMPGRHDRHYLMNGSLDRSLFKSCTVPHSQCRFMFQDFVRQLLLLYQTQTTLAKSLSSDSLDIAKKTVFGPG